jgi:hypothetical protein
MALKPPALSPMYYENAAIYTNSLLDAYMDYKNAGYLISAILTRLADCNRFTATSGLASLISRPARRN